MDENAREKAVSKLMPVVYDELRKLARHYLRRERAGQSLQATALVNEAYLRLKKDKRQPWQNRTHFFAIAATSMRQILVERARARNAAKRGGEQVRITLDDAIAAEGEKSLDLLALDEALTRLAAFDPEQARIVELRFFAGLSIEESAEALGVSPATVKRGWTMAKAWLKRELQKEGARGA
jgi:RNA polymerase sigma-70 factor (ECF subfamily)